MKLTGKVCLALIFTLFAQLAYPEPEGSKNDNIVIVLSWDGMRHDYPDRGQYPTLKHIEKSGIRAGRLTPVSLSNTFPGHVSLATGTTPDQHGIVDNVFYDREKGMYVYSGDADWINAEPVWIAAERQGVKAATYFWVGSETDWRGQGTSYRMAPFDSGRPEADKVDKIIEWLDLDEAERPRLIMSYWRGADSVGHMKGPDHPDVQAIIGEQDKELGRLLDAIESRGLWPKTTLMIVSDHGMTEVSESIAIKAMMADAGLRVNVTGGASAQHLFLQSDSDRTEVLKVLATHPHITVHTPDNAPAGMNAPNRTGDIIVSTKPPYTFAVAETLLQQAIVTIGPMLGWRTGMHGYDPEMPDMGAIFFAMGNGVTSGKPLPEIHQLDIAPTITRLLGIDKPGMALRDGVSLE